MTKAPGRIRKEPASVVDQHLYRRMPVEDVGTYQTLQRGGRLDEVTNDGTEKVRLKPGSGLVVSGMNVDRHPQALSGRPERLKFGFVQTATCNRRSHHHADATIV